MSKSNLSSLNYLLKASSKALVEKCLNIVFASRSDSARPTIEALHSLLEITDIEANQLYGALYECIDACLTTGSIDALAVLFSEDDAQDIDKRLKNLIGQTIRDKLPIWKEAAFANRLALPKYVDVDWAVHIGRASSEVSPHHSYAHKKDMSHHLSMCGSYTKYIRCLGFRSQSQLLKWKSRKSVRVRPSHSPPRRRFSSKSTKDR
jgi:hypothetical protein